MTVSTAATLAPGGPAGDPRALRRADFAVHRDITTRWSDEDAYGHVNNVVAYSLMDTAVNGWLMAATGTDIRRLPAIGVVAETACRYLSELRFPETISVGIGLERLGERSVTYLLALFGEHADAPAVVGRFVHVYIDPTTRRPVPIPAEIRTALTTLRALNTA